MAKSRQAKKIKQIRSNIVEAIRLKEAIAVSEATWDAIRKKYPEAVEGAQTVNLVAIAGDCLWPWLFGTEFGSQIDYMRQQLLSRGLMTDLLNQVQGAVIIAPSRFFDHAAAVAYWSKHGRTVDDLSQLPDDWEVQYHKSTKRGNERRQHRETYKAAQKPADKPSVKGKPDSRPTSRKSNSKHETGAGRKQAAAPLTGLKSKVINRNSRR